MFKNKVVILLTITLIAGIIPPAYAETSVTLMSTDSSGQPINAFTQIILDDYASTPWLVAGKVTVSAKVTSGYGLSMWVQVADENKIIGSGFTPVTFTGIEGKSYTVIAHGYSEGGLAFEKWSDGVTSNVRKITMDGNVRLTAIYSMAQGMTDSITIIAQDQNQQERSMYTVIRDQAGTILSTGYTPFTFTGAKYSIVSVEISNYNTLEFQSWSDGLTSATRNVVLNGATLTARYIDHVGEHSVYVPAYWGTWKQSLIDEWDKLIISVESNQDINFLVAINPASGPGDSQNTILASKINRLKDAGATVIGYVGVNYFSELPKSKYPVGNLWPSDTPKTMADLKKDIDKYKSFYPMLDGFMFDDYPSKKTIVMPNGSTKYVYSLAQELNNYARSRGADFIKTNPGTGSDNDYFTFNENMSTYEGQSIPTVNKLDAITLNGVYKSKTTVVVHSLTTLPSSSTISALYDKVDYVYITNNTYNTLPSYWTEFLKAVSNS